MMLYATECSKNNMFDFINICLKYEDYYIP
nr:MAG TPA: hypothetical protein [Caudoviricetes sp.]